jgi:hypothetical protein
MSMLTAEQYEEYIQLLRAWVDAEKALGGPAEASAEADQRVREAYAAVQSFRAQHELGEPAMAVAAEPEVAERAR